MLYNATPFDLQLAVNGPTATIGTAAACDTCKVFSSRSSARCTLKGPRITLTLPAGKYAVDIRYPDQGDTPSIGTWSLRAGSSYEGCFYLYKK